MFPRPSTRFICCAPDGRWAGTVSATRNLTGARFHASSRAASSHLISKQSNPNATRAAGGHKPMALSDRRTLDGVYSVRQSVNHIMNYRFAEERMMRMMAGWIALTPEIPVKLEMAKQVYEDALHADALGKRLPELRAQAQVSKPANE